MSSINFRKQGPLSSLAMFEAEAEGFAELKKAGALRVPEVYDVGTDADGAYTEMERFEFVPGGERFRLSLPGAVDPGSADASFSIALTNAAKLCA